MATATPTGDGEAAYAVGETWNLPTDAFAEILVRVPPSSRRRLRLVCRRWRDVIDERTPQSLPVVLAYVVTFGSASAYVVEDLAEGRCRELWRGGATAGRGFSETMMVGTCNGLLCLCDDSKPSGAVALANPVTGETLDIPPLPWAGHGFSWHRQYSFAYHPATGQYKILHLPCGFDRTGGFNVLQVFTLGEAAAAWRDVPVPGASCRLDAGIVSVGGATYWVTSGAERVVSFDLRDERVAFAKPLPVRAGPGYLCHLTEVCGRLGLAISADKPVPAKTEVWVLGDGQGWSRRYSVRVNGDVEQRLARPHFAHGEYVLTAEGEGYWRKYAFGHRLRGGGARLQRGEVRSVRITERGTPVAGKSGSTYLHGTFAYVETTEPLSVYRLGG